MSITDTYVDKVVPDSDICKLAPILEIHELINEQAILIDEEKYDEILNGINKIQTCIDSIEGIFLPGKDHRWLIEEMTRLANRNILCISNKLNVLGKKMQSARLDANLKRYTGPVNGDGYFIDKQG